MEIEFGTEKTQQSEIKTEFLKNSEDQKPTLTPAEIELRKTQIIKNLKKEIEWMKVQEEYNDLRIKLYEQDIWLGNEQLLDKDNNIRVPGLLGLELYMKRQQVVGSYMNYQDQLKNRINELEKQQTTGTSPTNGQ